MICVGVGVGDHHVMLIIPLLFSVYQLVSIGDVAPDFELLDQNGNKYKLSSFRGRRVLLSFYRFAA